VDGDSIGKSNSGFNIPPKAPRRTVFGHFSFRYCRLPGTPIVALICAARSFKVAPAAWVANSCVAFLATSIPGERIPNCLHPTVRKNGMRSKQIAGEQKTFDVRFSRARQR